MKIVPLHVIKVLLWISLAIGKSMSSTMAHMRSADQVCNTAGCKRAASKISEYIDPSVDPCDNFYKFACGGFIKNNPIPSDKPGITPYRFIHDILQNRLKTLFEESPQTNETKPFIGVKKFYRACMDTEAIENRKTEPIISKLQQVGGWPVLEGEKWSGGGFDWKDITCDLKDLGMFHEAFVSNAVSNHLRNTTLRILVLDQAELGVYQEILSQGLGNQVVQAYYKLMTKIAVLFGANPNSAENEMLDALNLEIDIAKISVPAEKRRDFSKLFNPTTLTQMEKIYPSIPWIKFANKLFKITKGETLMGSEKVNIQEPEFLKNIVVLLHKTPKRVQANYAIWRAVLEMAPYLNQEIQQELLAFDKLRTGVKEQMPRWQKCVGIMSKKLPLLGGAMYVRRYFPPEARDQVKEIVDGIKNIFNQTVKNNDWMEESTKQHAMNKLSSMFSYVGFADELLNDNVLEEYFSELHINEENFLQLGLNTSLFLVIKSNQQLRETISRSDWTERSTPAVVNAYYSLTDNTIEFPAGILQDVYFDEKRPRYINYGAIGFLIGHEITHGFDDQGRQFDENGNLVDWWDKKTNDAFLKKAECIVQQYNNYTVEEIGLNINGVSSQGENIADNGGVRQSYLAYQKWLKHHSPEAILPGLKYTVNQLFWISAANIWCANYSPEYMRLLVQTNAHCPSEFRVIGAFQNNENFAKDFGCSVGSPMNPSKKCSVW